MAVKVKPVRITRPAGRRTGTEKRLTNYMVGVGNAIQAWMIDNNRIATGRSINSLNVVVTRQARVDKTLAATRRTARQSGGTQGQDYSDSLKAAQRILNKTNLGLVSVQLKAAPSLQFALDGRGPGKQPPVAAIERWMTAKGLKPKAESLKQSAYLIARKIGAVGTNEPHFNQKFLTTVVGASLNRMLSLVVKPLAKAIGRKFVRFLLGVTKDFDNMTLSHKNITLFNEALDAALGSNETGTNPPKT